MPYSAVSFSGAGTRFYYEDPVNPDVWVYLSEAVSLGPVQQKRSFIDKSPIGDLNRSSIPGDDDVSESEIVVNHVLGNADMLRFHVLAEQGERVRVRVDSRVGTRFAYTIQLAGFEAKDPTRDSVSQIGYPYQRVGDVITSEIPASE